MGNIVSSNKNVENECRATYETEEGMSDNQQNLSNKAKGKAKKKSGSDDKYFNDSKTAVVFKQVKGFILLVEFKLIKLQYFFILNSTADKDLTQKQFDDFISKINVENKVTAFKFEACINVKKKENGTVSKNAFKARNIPVLTTLIEKKYKNIKELKLSFPSQSESNSEIDAEPINSICNMLGQLKNLESLSLNFFQWGYYNSNIKSESITNLCSAIVKLTPNLKTLKLDFGRWGCEKYGNLKIYSDETISSMCDMIRSLQNLRTLDINLRSWGYENYKITNNSVIQIFQSVGTLKALVNLNINLTKWGYLNNNISENSLQNLKTYFEPLQNLKYIYLNFDLWTHLHNYKYIKEALVQLPLLEECHIDTTEEQSEVKKLCELIKYRQKNYLMAYSMIKSNQKDFFRQEILWDSLRVCMKETKKQQE